MSQNIRGAVRLASPRQDLERGRIRAREHVSFVDAGEALDRRSVEADALGERALELGRRDGDRLQHAEDVGEPQPNESDVALLDGAEHELDLLVHSSSLARGRVGQVTAPRGGPVLGSASAQRLCLQWVQLRSRSGIRRCRRALARARRAAAAAGVRRRQRRPHGRAGGHRLAGGGEVVGVIPQHLVDKEIAHPGLSDLRVTGSMHERKMLMADLADGFVAPRRIRDARGVCRGRHLDAARLAAQALRSAGRRLRPAAGIRRSRDG